MFRSPAIVTLNKYFGKENAKLIKHAIENSRNKIVALEKCDKILNGHGVECIPAGIGSNSPEIKYVNLGDTYSTTIILVDGIFRVGDWGSYVEKGNYN